MRSILFPLFCVGTACAVAGSLASSVLAAALAPEPPPFTLSEGEARVEESALDRGRLAALLRLQEKPPPPRPPDFRLRGTLAPMLATVEPAAGGRAHSVGVGDALGDTTIEEVGHGFLTLRNGVRLAMSPVTVPEAARPAPVTFAIPRKDFEKIRQSLPLLAAQMRIVPAFESGSAIGFKVAWMAPDAFAIQAGLKPGDVITAVNGHRLTSTDAVLALAREAQTGTHFTADVLRGGATLRLEVKAL